MKIFILTFILVFFAVIINAKDKEKPLEKMTNEELIAKIIQWDKEQEEAKAKTAKMKEKTKALDELSKLLQIDEE